MVRLALRVLSTLCTECRPQPDCEDAEGVLRHATYTQSAAQRRLQIVRNRSEWHTLADWQLISQTAAAVTDRLSLTAAVQTVSVMTLYCLSRLSPGRRDLITNPLPPRYRPFDNVSPISGSISSLISVTGA